MNAASKRKDSKKNDDVSYQVFVYKEENPVRTISIDGETWFVAKDVCNILGHSNSRTATQELDDDEKGVRKVYTLKGMQEMTVINEAGLYTLILRSNKKEAKSFRRWITHDVLPQIRRTGCYSLTSVTPEAEDVCMSNVSKSMFPFAEKLLEKALACKTEDDFRYVMALDDIFKNFYGKSALEAAGIYLVTTHDFKLHEKFDSDGCNLSFLEHKYIYAWQHSLLPVLPEPDWQPCNVSD